MSHSLVFKFFLYSVCYKKKLVATTIHEKSCQEAKQAHNCDTYIQIHTEVQMCFILFINENKKRLTRVVVLE